MTQEFVFTPIHAIEIRTIPGSLDVEQVALTYACDFCLDSRVRWEYPCDGFAIPAIRFASQDGWLACDRCSEMIEADDHAGLLERSERSWIERGNPAIPALMVNIDRIQHGFWTHRTGERLAFG